MSLIHSRSRPSRQTTSAVDGVAPFSSRPISTVSWAREHGRCPVHADSGIAFAEYSVNATDWLLDSFLEDSDEVVVLRVIEPTSSAQTGFDAITREARAEAENVLDYLMKKNGDERQVREGPLLCFCLVRAS